MAWLHHNFHEFDHHQVTDKFSNGHEKYSKNRGDPEEA